MKKNQGFTLIEILAVIVILAVIALITTPIVIGIIDKAKRGALQDSAYGLIDSANLYYAEKMVENNNEKLDFTFSDGIQTSDNKLNYKGKVENGSLKLFKDSKTAVCITEGKYVAIKNVNDEKVIIKTGRCEYNEETNEYETRELCQDLQDEIDELKRDHQKELDKLKKEYEEKIKKLKEDHALQIKNLDETYKAQIDELNKQIESLKAQHQVDIEKVKADYEAQLKTQSDAYELQIKTLNDQMNVLRAEMNDGKKLIANTITNLGILTSGTDTFTILSNNIKKLSDKRYNDGYLDGQKSVNNESKIVYVRHHHTGAASGGGGCYTKAHVHSGNCYGMCPNTYLRWTHDATNNFNRSYFICDRCGWNGHNGGGINHSNWYNPHQSQIATCGLGNIYELGCGMVEGQIISATITY